MLTTKTRRFAAPILAAALAATMLAACGDEPAPTATSEASSPSTSDSTTSTAPSSTSGTKKSPSCAADTAAAMTPTQRAGQLLMVALDPSAGPTGLDSHISEQGLGSMLYLGGWRGQQAVTEASAHLQQVAPRVDGRRVGMLIAADQEGGEVQQLQGDGFTTIPSGVEQGKMAPAELRAAAAKWGAELQRAGVNVNLAPVADTVPAELGTGNGPIGKHQREYGTTPEAATKGSVAFSRGMLDAKVQPTVKHFPGIGRIRGNTDVAASGITDATATTKDPYLAPFTANIKAGVPIVMVGSAKYPKLDAQNQATFSTKIITDLLRQRLDFDGVVITDDVGVAAAVADVPVPDRATRFIDAGGDIVLTAQPTQVQQMVGAIVAKADKDPAFAKKVDASVVRVLTLKKDMGLLECG